MAAIDHILVIGFGGPTKPEDIRPFLAEVTRGTRIPETRIADVVHHYERVGGRSPYNDYTIRLCDQLKTALRAHSVQVPLFLGMKNWHPFLADTLRTIHQQRLSHGLGVVLAPHRCDASFEKYLRGIDEAKQQAAAPEIQYGYLGPWHEHPLFIAAQTDQIQQALNALSVQVRASAHILFTAHSIPVEMAKHSRYVEEFDASSRAVATALGRTNWSLAYQSRSGSSMQPWLEPDVESVIRELKAKGEQQVVVVPIGFLCDHVEVLFDLDIEAKVVAEEVGLGFARASTVMDHPQFVRMFVELIQRDIRR